MEQNIEQNIEVAVRAIVVKQLGVRAEDVSLEKSFTNDLGADSLDIVELVMMMEQEFGLDIAEDEAEHIRTVGDAVAFIRSKNGST